MHKLKFYVIAILGVLPSLAIAAGPIDLSDDAYNEKLGIVIIQVNHQ